MTPVTYSFINPTINTGGNVKPIYSLFFAALLQGAMGIFLVSIMSENVYL